MKQLILQTIKGNGNPNFQNEKLCMWADEIISLAKIDDIPAFRAAIIELKIEGLVTVSDFAPGRVITLA